MTMARNRDQVGATEPAAGLAIDWPSTLARHDCWLRTVILARVADRQAVDDIMQEVSLAAVRQQAPLRDGEKVAPWLYRLAVRQSLLYRRRRGRQRKLLQRYAGVARPGESDHHEPDPLSWLLGDERRHQVRAAMARLSPRDAEILLLKYTQNWSYHQLAEHLGTSHSAVESRLHRARAKLRGELTAMQVIEAAP